MKYILDAPTLAYCSGISKYKNYSTAQILYDVFYGRQIFISIYTLLSFFGNPNYTSQLSPIFDFIFKHKIIILPEVYTSNLDLSCLNNYLANYGYRFVNEPFKFCKNAELFTITDSCLLDKINTNGNNTNQNNFNIKEIDSCKQKVENTFLKIFSIIEQDNISNKEKFDKKNYEEAVLSNILDKLIKEYGETIKYVIHYLSLLNHKKISSTNSLDKDFVYNSMILTYLPDFCIFTIDKQIIEVIKTYNTQCYRDLDSFIKKHP